LAKSGAGRSRAVLYFNTRRLGNQGNLSSCDRLMRYGLRSVLRTRTGSMGSTPMRAATSGGTR
jgi:hypothetical protein